MIGRSKVTPSIVKLLHGVGARLVTAEVNPLFVLPQGQGVRAADALAVLEGEASATPA